MAVVVITAVNRRILATAKMRGQGFIFCGDNDESLASWGVLFFSMLIFYYTLWRETRGYEELIVVLNKLVGDGKFVGEGLFVS